MNLAPGELTMLTSLADEPRAPTTTNPTAIKLVAKGLAAWRKNELHITREGMAQLWTMGLVKDPDRMP